MADRRKTPDILGDLLGGGRPPAPERDIQSRPRKTSGNLPQMPVDSSEYDVAHLENLLDAAASALVLVAEVLGRQRLVDWLAEMKEVFAVDDTVDSRRSPAQAFKQSAATWAEKHLESKSTDIHTLAHGQVVTSPYEVDVCAHFKGMGSQSDLDIWIECMDTDEIVKKNHIIRFVQKATDVFHAAHTDKQDFWFDRLILISKSAFDEEALASADQQGVACVFFDGTNFKFQSKANWKLKPAWLKDAEASEGITWHSQK